MKYQTITEKQILELARDSLNEKVSAIQMAIDRIKQTGLEVSEGIMKEYEIASEQLEELTDRIEAIERSVKKGGVGEMARLKVQPEYGDWYYQKIELYNEEDDQFEHLYALYEGDSYVGEFGNVTAMKHYARTGQRW